MLRVACEKWDQKPDDLRRLSIETPHARTRERFMALYQATQGYSAMRWAEESDRHHQTVQSWIRRYNKDGPDALTFRRTGGWPPFAQKSPTRSAL
jgi:transposase